VALAQFFGQKRGPLEREHGRGTRAAHVFDRRGCTQCGTGEDTHGVFRAGKRRGKKRKKTLTPRTSGPLKLERSRSLGNKKTEKDDFGGGENSSLRGENRFFYSDKYARIQIAN